MNSIIAFILTAAGFGVALAMDAFSVSLANGLGEPKMKLPKMLLIAGTFSFFQAVMPLIGWFCVHTVAEKFSAFQKLIPWIALILLLFIGGKMLFEGLRGCEEESACSSVTFGSLIVQGIATSIDALSTGFGISDYSAWEAVLTALIIAGMTFIICMSGIAVGKKFGTKLAGKATVLGGVILCVIGIYIFISGVFG